MGITITKGSGPKKNTPTGQVAVSSKSATATTSVKYPSGAEKVTQEKVPTNPVSSAPAYVSVSLGVTRNLGNYESVKASVIITLPCEPSEVEIEATYEAAKAWADTKMNSINEEISSQLGEA